MQRRETRFQFGLDWNEWTSRVIKFLTRDKHASAEDTLHLLHGVPCCDRVGVFVAFLFNVLLMRQQGRYRQE